MWNCPKNLLSSVVREKERGRQARAQNRKLHLFFSPDPHWDTESGSKRSTAKKMIKCGVKVSKKSLSEKMSLHLTKHVCCVSLWRRLEETHSWYKRTMWEKSTKIPMFRSIAQRNIKSYLTKLSNRLCFMDFGSVLCCSYLTDKEYGNYWYFLASLLRIP